MKKENVNYKFKNLLIDEDSHIYINKLKKELRSIRGEMIYNSEVVELLLKNFLKNKKEYDFIEIANQKNKQLQIEDNTYKSIKELQLILLQQIEYDYHISFATIIKLLINTHKNKKQEECLPF